MTKRRPSYAKQFEGRPYPSTNWLLLGLNGFQIAGRQVNAGMRNIIAMHPENTPLEIDWSLLRGLSVLIVEHNDIGHEYRHQLIDALALAGVRECHLIPASKRWADFCTLNVPTRGVTA